MTLHWHTEPLLLVAMLVPAWLYALWTGPFSPASCPRAHWARHLSFYSGILMAYLAVGSPIDALGERYLFWVHMLQHLLLMYVVPPLLILGIPPAHADRLFETRPNFTRLFGKLVHPVVAGLLFTLIFSLWHVPKLYELALANKTVHIIEHATVFLPSLMLCWGLFSGSERMPALTYPTRLLLMFLLTIGQLPVFGALTMTGEVLYQTYAWAPRIMGIGPLEDQVLGGLIMKVGGMAFVFPVFAYAFFKWAKVTEQEDLETASTAPPTPPRHATS
jgi:putative membrane protein